MFAIAVNALYTTLRRRGTTRQLAGAIVTGVVSALLLLPAIFWYNMRFSTEQGALSVAEVELALVYVAIWGWLLPLSVTATYSLFTLPRTSTSSVHIPRQKRPTRANALTAVLAPRRQPGVQPPFVFSEDTPWGWLEYRVGRFQGQRLALTRAILTIGREEDNDVWLDDEMASRYHAELAWDEGRVFITDCDSLNGVLLNGKRIRGSAVMEQGALLEIGSHRFLFEYVSSSSRATDQDDDPLSRHVWRTAEPSMKSEAVPLTKPLGYDRAGKSASPTPVLPMITPVEEWQETAQLNRIASSPGTDEAGGAFVICDGAIAGQSFLLDRPVLTIGRGCESDVIINDISISRRHAQVIRQARGVYIQDLASRNGTKVNDESLKAPCLLQHGDIVCVGNIRLEYTSVQTARTTPIPLIITPAPNARSISEPVPLRLPSRLKN